MIKQAFGGYQRPVLKPLNLKVRTREYNEY